MHSQVHINILAKLKSLGILTYLVGLQILFWSIFFCRQWILLLQQEKQSWRQRKYPEGFDFRSRHSSTGGKGQPASRPPAEVQPCEAKSPLQALTKPAHQPGTAVPPALALSSCVLRALPQGMSHLPKDSLFVNESRLLKTRHLYLTLAMLPLKKAQLLPNTAAFRNSTFLIPPGARGCLQFSL